MSLDDQVQRVIPVGAEYVLMGTANTYARGVDNLRQACSTEDHSVHPTYRIQDGTAIYRPLTFKEVIQARVEDYELHARDDPNRLRLFNTWLDSCCGVANKMGSTQLKLNPLCGQLIEIDPNFRGAFLPVDYDSLRASDGWRELDSSQRDFKERAWIAALDEDPLLYHAYKLLVLAKIPNVSMDFLVRRNTEQDELRATYVGNLYDGSYVDGDDLSYSTRLLRVAPCR